MENTNVEKPNTEKKTNEEIVETIRCLIKIFYKEKYYKNLLSYKQYFQEFKENRELLTDLSLRKFTLNMSWIKNYSYIAPSYQLNWNAIKIAIIPLILRFNPILNKTTIFKVIESFPFFISLLWMLL